MPNISRATLPQEFFDITSAQLLIQPEPQYVHAALIKQALGAELDGGGPLGLPMTDRQFGASGAPYGDLDGSRLVLADPVYREAIKVVTELGQERVGHTVRINRPKFTNSTYTLASRSVPVGTTISTTPINVESEQTSITLGRLAGPYDNGAAGVRPFGIERFDANKAVHSIAAIKEFHIKRDFDRTLDTIGVQLFDGAATTIYPTGMAANNDSVEAGDFPFSLNQILATRTSMSNGQIPTFGNGRYAMILLPLQLEQLDKDPDYQRLVRTFENDMHPVLRKAYRGSVNKFDIFESTTLTTTANSSGVPIQHGQAFGPGAVGVGVGGMPRTAVNTQDNYGETVPVIWLWYVGFSLLDNRFCRSVRSS